MGISSIMDSKLKIIAHITESLDKGIITKRDLQNIIDKHSSQADDTPAKKPSNRLSAVDIMFYIAAIVLFAAIVALIGQSWDNGIGMRIFLSAGIGVLFWSVATYFIQFTKTNDIRGGITNALLLTGSLSLIAGGFIIANEFVDFDDFHFYAVATTLTALGLLHIVFGWQIRRDLLVLMGTLLTVAAFPTLVLGLLSEADVPMFINCLVVAISGGLLAYATRVVSWIEASSSGAARAFDSLSAFIALMSLYVASYDSGTGFLWLLVMILGIVGLFYLSITMQDKLMLGNGSLFLVIAVITISFRYFSGYGVATSLFIGALGLIGTAIVATTINRRYIK